MRPEKQLLLDEIKHKIDASKAFVLTSYQKMDPNLASTLRVKLGSTGGSFAVLSKRLLIKAAQKDGMTFDRKQLQGHIGIVFANVDPVQTTKSIFDFCKENESVLEVLGGRFEGKLVSRQDVKEIAELPSKDEMRAQLLSVLEAPLSGTLSVMESALTSILFCLENKSSETN